MKAHWRRIVRFSLGGAMLAMLGLAFALAYARLRYEEMRVRRAIEDSITENLADWKPVIERETRVDNPLAKLFARDDSDFETIVSLRLENKPLTPANVRQIGFLRNLRELVLLNCSIEDDWIEPLGELEQLEVLDLSRNNHLTDEGLEHLSTLTNLRKVRLGSTLVTGSGISHLANARQLSELSVGYCFSCAYGERYQDERFPYATTFPGNVLRSFPELTKLQLYGVNITDEDLQYLPEGLESLYLRETLLTDVGVTRLVHRNSLVDLGLSGSSVTDASLESIATCKNLKTLDLSGTKITVAGLEAIATCKNLKTLNLSGTKITADRLGALHRLASLDTLMLSHVELPNKEMREFQSAHPNAAKLRVYWDRPDPVIRLD